MVTKKEDAQGHVELTRADIEELLLANHFKRGAAHEDPEKDATHVFHDRSNDRFVRFADNPDDEEGLLVYGDLSDPGRTYTYLQAIPVLLGMKTVQESLADCNVLPESVLGKYKSLLNAESEKTLGVLAPHPQAAKALTSGKRRPPKPKDDEETETDDPSSAKEPEAEES